MKAKEPSREVKNNKVNVEGFLTFGWEAARVATELLEGLAASFGPRVCVGLATAREGEATDLESIWRKR